LQQIHVEHGRGDLSWRMFDLCRPNHILFDVDKTTLSKTKAARASMFVDFPTFLREPALERWRHPSGRLYE
jgi:hypothetical protein